ncbi:PREDICTED: IQ motif-containing protein H-like isoform X2 [Acropora digitifera]|uniref:IQ motif-containing protein H-like isoform X2 n=1 Tax=Acropora digitifera TaxID=70779 RepID=UPI00077A7A6C|nr:PREDICTED: IQ motif-containing protein H-like isoform X2 [Acropora digitifera]
MDHAKPESTDIGEILVKVQDDLRHLKEQITGSSTEAIDIEALESAIERTEQSVKDKAEQMIHSNINKVLTLPPLESHGTYKKKHEDTTGYICKMHH